MSMRRTRFPLWVRPAAREIAVVVFPVPPFCEAIATIVVIWENLLKARNGCFSQFCSVCHCQGTPVKKKTTCGLMGLWFCPQVVLSTSGFVHKWASGCFSIWPASSGAHESRDLRCVGQWCSASGCRCRGLPFLCGKVAGLYGSHSPPGLRPAPPPRPHLERKKSRSQKV